MQQNKSNLSLHALFPAVLCSGVEHESERRISYCSSSGAEEAEKKHLARLRSIGSVSLHLCPCSHCSATQPLCLGSNSQCTSTKTIQEADVSGEGCRIYEDNWENGMPRGNFGGDRTCCLNTGTLCASVWGCCVGTSVSGAGHDSLTAVCGHSLGSEDD